MTRKSREGLSLLRKKGSLFAPSTIYLPFLTSKMSAQMSLVLFALSGYFLKVLHKELVKRFLERLLAYWYIYWYWIHLCVLLMGPLCPILRAQEICFKFQGFCTFLPLCMAVINTSLDFSITYQRCNSKCKPLSSCI